MRRIVAWVDGDHALLFKSDTARKDDLADGRHVANQLFELGKVTIRLRKVGRIIPDAGRFDQTVGNPHVRVGRVVGIQDLARSVGRAVRDAPKPSRLVFAEILFRPGKHLVKRLFVIGHQREEHPVGLTFGGRDELGFAVVNDAALRRKVRCFKLVPKSPGARRSCKHGRDQAGKKKFLFHVVGLLLVAAVAEADQRMHQVVDTSGKDSAHTKVKSTRRSG